MPAKTHSPTLSLSLAILILVAVGMVCAGANVESLDNLTDSRTGLRQWEIRGRAIDSQGRAVSHAQLGVQDPIRQQSYAVECDENGWFLFESVSYSGELSGASTFDFLNSEGALVGIYTVYVELQLDLLQNTSGDLFEAAIFPVQGSLVNVQDYPINNTLDLMSDHYWSDQTSDTYQMSDQTRKTFLDAVADDMLDGLEDDFFSLGDALFYTITLAGATAACVVSHGVLCAPAYLAMGKAWAAHAATDIAFSVAEASNDVAVQRGIYDPQTGRYVKGALVGGKLALVVIQLDRAVSEAGEIASLAEHVGVSPMVEAAVYWNAAEASDAGIETLEILNDMLGQPDTPVSPLPPSSNWRCPDLDLDTFWTLFFDVRERWESLAGVANDYAEDSNALGLNRPGCMILSNRYRLLSESTSQLVRAAESVASEFDRCSNAVQPGTNQKSPIDFELLVENAGTLHSHVIERASHWYSQAPRQPGSALVASVDEMYLEWGEQLYGQYKTATSNLASRLAEKYVAIANPVAVGALFVLNIGSKILAYDVIRDSVEDDLPIAMSPYRTFDWGDTAIASVLIPHRHSTPTVLRIEWFILQDQFLGGFHTREVVASKTVTLPSYVSGFEILEWDVPHGFNPGLYDSSLVVYEVTAQGDLKIGERRLLGYSRIRIRDRTPNIPDATTILAIDLSNSMNWNESSGQRKLDAARDAALDILEVVGVENSFFGSGHRIGVTGFNSEGRVLLPPTSDLLVARETLETLTDTAGGTNIAQGLDKANSLLGDAEESVIILLSDGVPTHSLSGQAVSDRSILRQEILDGPVKDAGRRHRCIYVIGFGIQGGTSPTSDFPSADYDFLQAIVDVGGCGSELGEAASALELRKLIWETRAVALLRPTLGTYQGTIRQDQTVELETFDVEPQTETLFVSLGWPGSKLELEVTDPRGTSVNGAYPGTVIESFHNMVYAVVSRPESGQWGARITGRDVPTGETEYVVLVSADVSEILPIDPMTPSAAEEPELGMIKFTATGSVDIALRDPKGLIVSRDVSQIDDATYQDHDDEFIIGIPHRVVGDYELRVNVNEGTDRLDRFEVSVTDGFDTIHLAENKFIIHAPSDPYVVRSTREGIADVTDVSDLAPIVDTASASEEGGLSVLGIPIHWIALGGAVLLGGIGALSWFLKSRYYI